MARQARTEAVRLGTLLPATLLSHPAQPPPPPWFFFSVVLVVRATETETQTSHSNDNNTPSLSPSPSPSLSTYHPHPHPYTIPIIKHSPSASHKDRYPYTHTSTQTHTHTHTHTQQGDVMATTPLTHFSAFLQRSGEEEEAVGAWRGGKVARREKNWMKIAGSQRSVPSKKEERKKNIKSDRN